MAAPPLSRHGTAARGAWLKPGLCGAIAPAMQPTYGQAANRLFMNATTRPPRIFAVGGAHIDRRGRMTADFVAGASIPGTMQEDVGGGTFNALRTAVRRGARGTLMSVRGGDGAGLQVAEAIAAEGIHDVSAVFLDRATPSYTALLDRQGEVVAALADMALYETALPKQMRRTKIREQMAHADAVLTDANLPAVALERLAAAAAGLPVFAIAISPAKAVRLGGVLPFIDCLFMNGREAAALAGAAGGDPAATLAALTAKGLRRAVMTNGASAVFAADEGAVWRIAPPRPRRIADVTGAGDALAGAAAAALLRSAGLAEAVREGMAAAMLALESTAAVPAFTPAEFGAALELVPAAEQVA